MHLTGSYARLQRSAILASCCDVGPQDIVTEHMAALQVCAGMHRDQAGRQARRPGLADRLRLRLQVQQRGLEGHAQRQHAPRSLAGPAQG